MCKSNVQERKKQIHGVKEDESSDDELYVGSVGTTPAMSKSEWHADVKMEDKTLTVQLDTGARCNAISIQDLQRLGININLDKPEAQTTRVIFWTCNRHERNNYVSTKGKYTL